MRRHTTEAVVEGCRRKRKFVALGWLLVLVVLSAAGKGAPGKVAPGKEALAKEAPGERLSWANTLPSGETPASSRTLPSETTSRTVVPGLEYLLLARGEASDATGYRIVIGPFDSQSEASSVLERLGALAVDAFPESGGGVYSVVTASSVTRREAEDLKESLLANGFSQSLEIQEITHDPNAAGGPWRVNVLLADPQAIDVRVTHAADAAIGLETTRELAVRKGALAAINGGYFRMTGLLAGDSQGVLQIDGALLSEPDRGRGAVGFYELDGATRAVFGRPTFRGEVRLDGEVIAVIDGINRPRRSAEIVLYTPQFHRTTLTDPGGTEIVIRDGTIDEVHSGAGSSPIPHDGFVLSIGSGRAEEIAALLSGNRENATIEVTDERITIEMKLLPLLPDPDRRWYRAEDILGGGPLLLHHGERLEEPAKESISAAFYYARHPRTALGVRADGTLVLVTVDGRQPGVSVGMSIPELTDLMLELGCVSAVNLDGGGSTTMVIDGEIVNAPSSTGGPRRNGDAVLLFGRGK